MKKKILFLLSLTSALCANPIRIEEPPQKPDDGYIINFNEVSMAEFVRFVSRIAKVNFIFEESELSYPVNVVSGKPTQPSEVLDLLLHLLDSYGQTVEKKNGYYLIKEKEGVVPLVDGGPKIQINLPPQPADKFHVYKLQYHEGAEILDTVKQIAHQIQGQPGSSPQLLQTINTMQWVKATNSILFSGPQSAVDRLCTLVDSLDTPLRQVFIEVLVVESGVRGSLEFGVDWATGGNYKNQVGFGAGEFGLGPKGRSFANSFQGVNASNPPSGPSQTPFGRGFDLSIIGDIILHKGKTFFTIGSLVSALETDNKSKILLNQKIITQDNKPSHIFMGENIPFHGSTIETMGQKLQTTSNIEYRDVGVSLKIRPRLGKQDIITLEIEEEISQAEPNRFARGDSASGILTSKTNMMTNVHVPDQSFLVLSGMVKTTETKRKSGLPCLGGLPVIGAAFGKQSTDEDKKAILVFVRPQIINSIDDYKRITKQQQAICTDIAPEHDISKALEILQQDTP